MGHENIGLDIAQLHESLIDTPSKKLQLLIKKTISDVHQANSQGIGNSDDDLDAVQRGDRDENEGGDEVISDMGSEGGSAHGNEMQVTNHPTIYTQKSIISGNE